MPDAGFSQPDLHAPGYKPTAPFNGADSVVATFAPPALPQTTRGQVPDWVNPMVHEGEVTLEHQLPKNMSISGSYVVSRAMRLPMFYDSNIAPSTTTRGYDVTDLGGSTQSSFTVPFYTSRINTTTGPILTGVSDVNTWYNSFVLTMRKKMSQGVEFVGNYTLAKASDGGQVPGQFGTFNGTDSPIDPAQPEAGVWTGDLDQRQRFVGSVIWIPQFTRKISNAAARYLLDGYAFSSIVTIAAGQPVTGTISGIRRRDRGRPTGGAVNNSYGDGRTFPGAGAQSVYGRGWATLICVEPRIQVRGAVKFWCWARRSTCSTTRMYSVNTQQYTYTGPGVGVRGHTNGCLVP